jgi:hypothetical protein
MLYKLVYYRHNLLIDVSTCRGLLNLRRWLVRTIARSPNRDPAWLFCSSFEILCIQLSSWPSFTETGLPHLYIISLLQNFNSSFSKSVQGPKCWKVRLKEKNAIRKLKFLGVLFVNYN